MRALLIQLGSIDQEAGDVGDLEALVVVGVALELQLHKHQMRIADHQRAASPHPISEVVTHVVNRENAEVVLTVNHQETGWNLGLLVQQVHHLSGYDTGQVLAILELADVD